MRGSIQQKVTASHLRRDAYVYVRKATVRRGFEHTGSTRRQYALRERAVASGWPVERLRAIDCDLGKSGARSAGREGFQQLVNDVRECRAGVVLAADVSRLTRSFSGWQRLLKICSRADTLILDEDGIYSARNLDGRLLLGGDLVPA